jgi:predicted ATPase with chaperone activity
VIGGQNQFPPAGDGESTQPAGDAESSNDGPWADAPFLRAGDRPAGEAPMPSSPTVGPQRFADLMPGGAAPANEPPDPFSVDPFSTDSPLRQENSAPQNGSPAEKNGQTQASQSATPQSVETPSSESLFGTSGLPPFLNSPAGTSHGGTASHSADLYAELFGVAPIVKRDAASGKGSSQLDQAQAPPPRSPKSLRESGLSLSLVCDLILKQLYLHGALQGVEIARNARLPFNVIDECLQFLKDDRCLEVTSGEVIGRVSYRFHLSTVGRERAKEAFDLCRYVGPAPVALEQYVEQCRRQAVSGINCSADILLEAFSDLIIPPHLLEELGPAVCSGKSIFLYGPPGNGKSQIAKGLGRFLNQYGGEIYVPYAIQSENGIVTIFDPSLHQTADDDELAALLGDASSPQTQSDVGRLLHENHPDMRWRRVRRPVVVTGGELTLEMLDLRYNAASNFYVAPLQVKANGGVFMIDDFGRQIVSPRDLLNRWILPLEERIDYVTLDTGKKFPVPFEQLIIFSTNLDPGDLVDDAFLRRIRHKILIDSPSREMYSEIFGLCCEQRKIPFEPRAVEYLYQNFYDQGQLPRSSDPRDLLEIVQSICRFRNQRLVLTQELMGEATSRFFAKV